MCEDKKLVSADVAKLHNEINQSVNQRFLLTAGAVTVFALVSKNIIPSNTDNQGVAISNLITYLAFLGVIGMLFFQSLRLRVIILSLIHI